MFFSIIIPTCNRNELLGKCLEKLSPSCQTVRMGDYEVIVSDDGKAPGARDYCNQHFPWVIYKQGPQRGPAANRNHAAAQAKGDWLVFTDDDCLPDKDWLKAFAEAIQAHDDVFAFEGRTEPAGVQTRFDEVAPINTTGQKFWSCNIMVHHSLFRKLEGFNEGFPYPIMEDTDFYERVKSQTIVVFVPSALVFHPWRRVTTIGLAKKMLKSHQYFLQQRGQVWDMRFRLQRFKLMISRMGMHTGKLARFKGKGKAYWIELLKFYAGMLVRH